MADIATKEPTQIRAGDTIQWTREDLTADYPASTWTLTYYLVKASETSKQYTIAATADSDYFDITITAATSALYTPGTYTMIARVSDGTQKFPIPLCGGDSTQVTIEILPDLGATLTSGYDSRTHAKIMLDAIQATLEGRADAAQLDIISKTIGDKNITRRPELLMQWLSYYESKVNSELTKEGTYKDNKIRVKFTSVA